MNSFKPPPKGAAKRLRERYYEQRKKTKEASLLPNERLNGLKLFKQTLDNTITALMLGIALAYFGTCIYYVTYSKTESKTMQKALSCTPETGSMNANEFRRCLLQKHLRQN